MLASMRCEGLRFSWMKDQVEPVLPVSMATPNYGSIDEPEDSGSPKKDSTTNSPKVVLLSSEPNRHRFRVHSTLLRRVGEMKGIEYRYSMQAGCNDDKDMEYLMRTAPNIK